MNRYKLSKAGINTKEGIARLSGKADLYEDMLNKFPGDTHFQSLLETIEQKDVEEAFQCSHALKGMAGNLSMIDFYDTLVPLVEEFRAGSMEHTEELMVPVKENYERVVEAIGPVESV